MMGKKRWIQFQMLHPVVDDEQLWMPANNAIPKLNEVSILTSKQADNNKDVDPLHQWRKHFVF